MKATIIIQYKCNYSFDMASKGCNITTNEMMTSSIRQWQIMTLPLTVSSISSQDMAVMEQAGQDILPVQESPGSQPIEEHHEQMHEQEVSDFLSQKGISQGV